MTIKHVVLLTGLAAIGWFCGASSAAPVPHAITVHCHRTTSLLCAVSIPVTPANNGELVTVLLPAQVLGVTLRTNNRDPRAEAVKAHALPGLRRYEFTLAVAQKVAKGTSVVATFALLS
jgi:hypothetical protein